jgi:hypothetical protein
MVQYGNRALTDVVIYGDHMRMKRNKGKADKSMKPEGSAASSVRATITFPPDVYESLEGIARQKKVSLAWVVREAAEQYLAEKWPLFSKGERG